MPSLRESYQQVFIEFYGFLVDYPALARFVSLMKHIVRAQCTRSSSRTCSKRNGSIFTCTTSLRSGNSSFLRPSTIPLDDLAQSCERILSLPVENVVTIPDIREQGMWLSLNLIHEQRVIQQLIPVAIKGFLYFRHE